MSYLAMLKNTWKIPVSGSGSGWLPKFNQFFFVQRHICGKICGKIFSSFYVKLLTDRHRDKRTDKRGALFNLQGRGNITTNMCKKLNVTRLLSNIRQDYPQMRAFSYALSLPVTCQTSVTPFDPPYPKTPCCMQTWRLYVC